MKFTLKTFAFMALLLLSYIHINWAKKAMSSEMKGLFMSKCNVSLLKSLLKNEEGVSSIEYAILASVISVGIVAGATAIGRILINPFNVAAGALGS